MAQAGVGEPGLYAKEFSVSDCFKNKHFSGKFRSDSISSNFVLKGQQIWRSIDLEDHQNKTLLVNNRGCAEVGLFEIIKFGLFDKKLNAFSSDDFNNAIKNRLSVAQIRKQISFHEVNENRSFDENGNEKSETLEVNRFLMGTDIKSYLLKEDWIFNAASGQTEKYIIGIAPLVFDPKKEKVVPLFWLYYPEWKELFASFEAKNYYSSGVISYADLFAKKYFISQISKESNVFDRSVKAVYHGSDVGTENENIKEKTNKQEIDLFPQ